MNRLLFVIPHYYRHSPDSDLGSLRETSDVRAATVARTLAGLHETFSHVLSVRPGHRSVAAARNVVEVVVVTTGGEHLLTEIGALVHLATHVEVAVPPGELGFAAHRILAEAGAGFDGYGYLEDDILVHDPLLFNKQRWFSSTYGSDALLLPNRFEASGGLKVHPDGPLPPVATAGLSQPEGPERLLGNWHGTDLVFEHPSNPHSGCFFVDREQMARLAAHPRFGVPHASLERTLETAASGPTAETFRIYKPAPPTADFLEVEHQGSYYLGLWSLPDATHVSEVTRKAAVARAELAEADLAAMRASRSWRVTAPLRRMTDMIRGPR